MSDILANILKESKNKMDTGSDLVLFNIVDGTIQLKQILLKLESGAYDTDKLRFILDHPDRGKLNTNKLASDEDDAYEAYVEEENIGLAQKLTSSGRQELRNWFIGESATGSTHIAVGSGSTAFSVDDTALGTEVARKAVTTPTLTSKKIAYEDVFNTLQGNGTIREMGILNAASNGTLFNRGVLAANFTKDNTKRMRISQEVTLSNAIPSISTSPVMDVGVNEVRDFLGGSSSTAPTHIAFGDGTGFFLQFPYITDSDTVILFHMNEDSGTSVKDISSSANDGTATGTTVVTAYFDKGRDFNGSSDFITVSDDSSLQLTNDYTIEMWVNADTFTQEGGADRCLLSKTDGTADGYEITLTSTGKVNFRKWDAGGAVDLTSDTSLVVDTWSHVACVQSSADGMKIYIDGVLDKSNSDTDATETDTTDLIIGKRSDAATGHFDGTLDEIRISTVERMSITTTDTTMLSEQVRNAIDVSSTFSNIAGYHEATLLSTQANAKIIRRTALFNAGSNGDMFMYQEHPEINKTKKIVILTRHQIRFI